MARPEEVPTADQAFLDEVFDRAVERLRAGATVTAGDLLEGRSELEREVEEMLRLARAVAVRPAGLLPTVPGYRLLREIGSGGMGSVFLARQTRLGHRPVALKILPPEAAHSERCRERFLREARALARLRHPGVVAVFDVVREGDLLAYSMEWIEGCSLAQLLSALERGEEPPELTELPRTELETGRLTAFLVRVALRIARALEAVHAASLVHRDVKPSNILLRADGSPLLTDFGLVREEESALLTRSGAFLGTPAFAPPEQLRGEREAIGPRSDVYALGATLYRALSGRLPFEGGSSAEILRRIEAGRAPRLARVAPGVPRDLETIVEKAMDPEPSRRYASAGELADDLQSLLDLRPICARRAGALVRALRLARRNRRTIAAAALGGGLAVASSLAVALYFLWLPAHAEDLRHRARLQLLNRAFEESILSTSLPVAAPRDSYGLYSSDRLLERYQRAFGLYQRADFWGQEEPLARMEKSAVSTAQALLLRSEELEAFLSRSPPELARYARAWTPPSEGGWPEPIDIAGAPEGSLRGLGLLAYMLGDAETAARAFDRLGRAVGEDPFADAVLAVLHDVLQRPDLAQPRYLAALQAMPDSPLLRVGLADAALRCGDAATAAHWLRRARELPGEDPYDRIAHVEADLAAWRGEFERAMTVYDELIWRHKSPRSHLHRSLLMRVQGRHEEAVMALLVLATRPHAPETYRRALAEAAEAWWGQLDTAARVERIARAREENPGSPASLAWLLSLCRGREGIGEDSLRHSPWERHAWRVPAIFDERWRSMNPQWRNPSLHPQGPSLGELRFVPLLLASLGGNPMSIPDALARRLSESALRLDRDRRWSEPAPRLSAKAAAVGLRRLLNGGAASLALAAIAQVAGAQCPVVWEAATGVYPDQCDPPWQLNQSTSPPPCNLPMLQGGVLVIHTCVDAEYVGYLQEEPALTLPPVLIMEARVRYVSGSASHASRDTIAIGFDLRPYEGGLLYIGDGVIFLNKSDGGTTCSQADQKVSVSTKDDFHTYRVEVVTATGAISVYYDGGAQPILTGSTFTAGLQCFYGNPRIFWGDGTGSASGISEWLYFAHNAGTTASANTYGTGKLNSQGCVPAIGATGFASASDPSPFLIEANGVVDNKNGILFYGYGMTSVPFQGGTLLVAPPLRRTPVQTSGGSSPCSGTYSFDMNAHIQSGADPLLTPSTTAYAQYWYRDPQSTSFPTGLTNALQFAICP